MRRFFGGVALTLCAALTMSFASCSSGSSDSEENPGTTTITTGNPADSSGNSDSEKKTGTSDVTTESPAESPENAAVTTESPADSSESSDSEEKTETPAVKNYTVTFDSDGGSEVASQAVESGKTATKPTDPTKTGYSFNGWYNGDTAFDFAAAIEGDVTLKAKWLTAEVFVKVTGTTIKGDETWTPSSSVFVSGRSLTIGDLYVSDHEVTQSEYEKYCKYGSESPSDTYGKGDNFPAYYVSWYDAVVYCNLRSMDEGLIPVYSLGGETDPSKWSGIVSTTTGDVTKYCGPSSSSSAWDYKGESDEDGGIIMNTAANGYRLPTEAEWEYIAREGKTSGTTYSGSDTIGDVAWYKENSGSKKHEVKTDKVTGTDSANALGIYDMTGNVWEWCWDLYGSISSSTDAAGAASGSIRVLRGGSWSNDADFCAVSYRNYYSPFHRFDILGFRVVRSSSN